MVARNCARHLVSNHEQDRQALSSQGLHSRACSSRVGAFLKACAQGPPPGVQLQIVPPDSLPKGKSYGFNYSKR